MELLALLCEQCIEIREDKPDKDTVLHEIASLARHNPSLQVFSEESIFTALKEREEAGSTGFGNHIAIPHCAIDEVKEFVIGLLLVPNGIDFNALDGKDTKLFVFIVGPREKRNEHIHLLSAISRILSNGKVVNEILASKTPSIARETFLRHSTFEIEEKRKSERSLFHVFIQNEDMYSDILRVFTEMDCSTVSIVEGTDASYYLHKLPLFAGFLTDKKRGFHRIVIALLPKTLANEVIRRISLIAGDLSVASGIMVIVQDVTYWNGSLNI